jgi:hypothetical protein
MTPATCATLALATLALTACGPSPEASSPVGISTGDPRTTKEASPPTDTARPDARAGKTLFVGPAVVDCEGEGPMRCLQVRESPSDEWTLFYDTIEGFDHEEGYTYELRVETKAVSNPPADGSSERTRLLEIVDKTKADSAK